MAMFCAFAGEKHKVSDVAPVTHYLRHKCTRCSYFSIFELCTQCADEVLEYIKKHPDWWWWTDNYTFCPKCQHRCYAHAVWTVYENKAE